MKKYLFDLDRTLIDTTELWPYIITRPGREYVSKNARSLNHSLYDKRILKLVSKLNQDSKIAVTTNAPRSYASALLLSHGFPQNLPIFSGLDKPSTRRLEKHLVENNFDKENCLVIGDSPEDIITARRMHSFSAGVLWGRTCKERMEKAVPSIMLENHDDLEQAIEKFEHDSLQRKFALSGWTKYSRLPGGYSAGDLTLSHSYLSDYYSHKIKQDEFSDKVRTFKASKDFNWEDIQNNKTNDYFAGGFVRTGLVFKEVIDGLYSNLVDKVGSLNIKNFAVASAPNSFPDYFYATDINEVIACRLNSRFKTNSDAERIFARVLAAEATHLGGKPSENTIGIRRTLNLNYDNIIIFDDILRHGSQKASLAKLLRYSNYKGNIHCLSLGKNAGR